MPAMNIHKEFVFSTLQKLYWLEAHMEELLLWESSIESAGGAKAALDMLIQDSERHKLILEKWFEKLAIKPPLSTPPGFPEKIFNFAGLELPEMFGEILKYEILAKGQYENLMNKEYGECLKSIIMDDNERAEFVAMVNEIAKDEGRHMEICRKHMGSFRRIMGR